MNWLFPLSEKSAGGGKFRAGGWAGATLKATGPRRALYLPKNRTTKALPDGLCALIPSNNTQTRPNNPNLDYGPPILPH